MARPSIPQRLRVFLGCEGESERSYAALLQQLIPNVHLNTKVLGGGDPLALIEKAIRLIASDVPRRAPYAVMGLLLDEDRLGQDADRDRRAIEKATASSLHLIWQRPCHEAILLRHLPGCEHLRPQTSELALLQLLRYWPQYSKGTSAVELSHHIGEQELRQVLPVEPELGTFLRALGLR